MKSVGDLISQYGGWLAGFIAVIGTIIYNRRKVQIDESALVLGKWKELVEAHQTQISTMNAELESLRKRVREIDNAFSEYRRVTEKRIADLESENAGLKRAIAQNSQSAAYQLGRRTSPPERGNRTAKDILRELDEEDGA